MTAFIVRNLRFRDLKVPLLQIVRGAFVLKRHKRKEAKKLRLQFLTSFLFVAVASFACCRGFLYLLPWFPYFM